MLVSDAMTSHPATVGTSTSVAEAFTALAEHRVSALPVVDGAGVVLGIVSEADLLPDAFPPDRRAHLIPPDRDLPPFEDVRTVAEVMTSPASTVHQAADVVEVVHLMTEHGFKSVPVVDLAGVLLGIVSRSDLVGLHARGDDAIAHDVTALFRDLQNPTWTVAVRDGVVIVRGPRGAEETALAEAGAAAVPGVTRVRVDLP